MREFRLKGGELTFVTDITVYICGENVKFMLFLFQIYVEKNLCGENLCGEKMTNLRSARVEGIGTEQWGDVASIWEVDKNYLRK